jgi:hypothetical protein
LKERKSSKKPSKGFIKIGQNVPAKKCRPVLPAYFSMTVIFH